MDIIHSLLNKSFQLNSVNYSTLFIIIIISVLLIATSAVVQCSKTPDVYSSNHSTDTQASVKSSRMKSIKSLKSIKKAISEKSKKESMVDSIKVMRGKNRHPTTKSEKATSPKARKDDTDSQHTEIIHVPLGKAAETKSPASLLTTPEKQKIHQVNSQSTKVTFAKKLERQSVRFKKRRGEVDA